MRPRIRRTTNYAMFARAILTVGVLGCCDEGEEKFERCLMGNFPPFIVGSVIGGGSDK